MYKKIFFLLTLSICIQNPLLKCAATEELTFLQLLRALKKKSSEQPTPPAFIVIPPQELIGFFDPLEALIEKLNIGIAPLSPESKTLLYQSIKKNAQEAGTEVPILASCAYEDAIAFFNQLRCNAQLQHHKEQRSIELSLARSDFNLAMMQRNSFLLIKALSACPILAHTSYIFNNHPPLQVALDWNSMGEIVLILLLAGADPNYVDPEEMYEPYIHQLIKNNRTDFACLLLYAGGNPHIKSYERSPSILAQGAGCSNRFIKTLQDAEKAYSPS